MFPEILETSAKLSSLKKNGQQWAGSGKFSGDGVIEATLVKLNTLGLPDRKYPWNRETLHRFQLMPIAVAAKVGSNVEGNEAVAL